MISNQSYWIGYLRTLYLRSSEQLAIFNRGVHHRWYRLTSRNFEPINVRTNVQVLSYSLLLLNFAIAMVNGAECSKRVLELSAVEIIRKRSQ